MNTVFTKLKDFVGFSEPDDYEYYDGEEVDDRDYSHAYHPEESTPIAAPSEDRTSQRRLGRDRLPFTAAAAAAPAPASEPSRSSSSRNNVIGMPGTSNGVFEVVVIEPRSFEKMPQVIQALRERKTVVLNLTMMDPDEAQRAVDFVAGGTYAIDGHQERVGESIFLFTPNSVRVTTQSGVIHEVGSYGARDESALSSTPTPAWIAEPDSIAQ